MIEELHSAIFYNDLKIDFVTFFSKDIGLNSITLNNIVLIIVIQPEISSYVRLMVWYNKFKQCKSCKKRQIKI